MNKAELRNALNGLKVEAGSLVCLGCGYEHNCGIHGCAIIRAAVGSLPPTTLNIGDSVWFVGLDDDTWVICKEKVIEIGAKGFFISCMRDRFTPGEYILYTDIGKEWFLTEAEAKQAVKDREKI